MLALLTLALIGASAADDAVNDPPSLVAAIEALQSPVKDFRCEFEGREVYKGSAAEATNRALGPDGLAETFGGSFVWQREGDRRLDLYTRQLMQNPITRESRPQVERVISIVHLRDRKVELSRVPNVRGAIELPNSSPFDVERENSNSRIGEIFRFDEIKEMVGNETIETAVTDDQVDGRPLKLLTVWLKLKDQPNILMRRYWIDMARSGQAERVESYLRGSLAVRWDIELKPFRVEGAEVWLPVAGEVQNHSGGRAEVAKAPLADRARVALETSSFEKEPTMIRSIRVIGGSMEINTKPAAGIFTLKYKPGAPKSPAVGDLVREFARKTDARGPSRAKAEALLEERIAEAAQQGRELIADPRAGIDWWTWSVVGLVAVLSASVVVLWTQRRTR